LITIVVAVQIISFSPKAHRRGVASAARGMG